MKAISIINSILFFLVLAGIGVCFLVLPPQVMSVAEKRKLATLPVLSPASYLNGLWSDGIDKYINDQFPMRLDLVTIATQIKALKGFTSSNNERIVLIKKSKQSQIADSLARLRGNLKDTLPNYLTEYDEAYSGSMLIVNGAVFTLNSGSPRAGRYFAKMLNEYAATLAGSTRVISCVPPLSSGFIPLEKYAHYTEKNQLSLLGIRDGLANGAIFADVMAELRAHAKEKLFFKTDHHWTPLGAYYGYVAFCKSAGFAPVPLAMMQKKTKYNFLGSLYELTRDEAVRKNPDTMDYYVPKVETSVDRFNSVNFDRPTKSAVFCHNCAGGGSYSTFLCGDLPLIRIKTNVNNGRKALVIKNSYGNAFAVYLVNHYAEVWVMDFRYAEHNILNLIRREKIDDLVFAVGMYGAMSHGTVQRMRNLGFNSAAVKLPPKIEEPKPSAPAVDTLKTPIENETSSAE